MKKLVKLALLALVVMALVNGGKINQNQKSVENNSNQVVLLDFDNSGDPEYVSLY